MIWLTWRQYRIATGIGIVVLVALSLLFVMDANALNTAMQQHHFRHCFDPGYLPCGIMVVPGNTAQWRSIASIVLPLLPLVVGVFLGAPLLSREYDQRTYLFAWTQSMSPTRWLSIKLLILGGATLIGFGLLSYVTTWWGLIQDNIASSPWNTFTIRGSVPVAEALLSLMVGVMIGAFLRRTLPSMALTLVLLLVIQTGISIGYPYLLPPISQLDYYNNIRQQHLIGYYGDYAQDLIVNIGYVGPDGKVIDKNIGCISLIGPYVYAGGAIREVNGVKQCLNKYQAKPLVEYQRFDERFWPLQFVTTILLLGLTVLVTVMIYWQLQRRIL